MQWYPRSSADARPTGATKKDFVSVFQLELLVDTRWFLTWCVVQILLSLVSGLSCAPSYSYCPKFSSLSDEAPTFQSVLLPSSARLAALLVCVVAIAQWNVFAVVTFVPIRAL